MSPAVVLRLGAVAVRHVHAPLTAGTNQKATKHRTAFTYWPHRVCTRLILLESLLVLFESLPSDIRRQMIPNRDLPLIDGGPAVSSRLSCFVSFPIQRAPMAISARIDRMMQHVTNSRCARLSPLKLALVRS